MRTRHAWFLILLWCLPVFAGPPANHKLLLLGQWAHAPVVDGDCTVCHTIHRDGVGPYLRAPVPELCHACHEDVAARDVVHEPVGEGRCFDCHFAHSSDHQALLRKEIPALCMDCHPASPAHVGRGTLCTSCHGVHSSDTAGFLTGERTGNCSQCHSDKSIGDSIHPPSREGKCLTCHFTHRDPRFAQQRLRAAYPSEMRVAFEPGRYALCDGCHDPELYGEPMQLETGFRTATENLHARHIRGSQGIACSGCHDIHATQGPSLMVEWVRPPGQQPRLMQYIRFSAGGSCGPACHALATYLREADAELVEVEW